VSFYLLLLLGWCGAAVVAAMVMGRFIVTGRGELGFEVDRHATNARTERVKKGDDARRGNREAA
jgi:hypothetical protein